MKRPEQWGALVEGEPGEMKTFRSEPAHSDFRPERLIALDGSADGATVVLSCIKEIRFAAHPPISVGSGIDVPPPAVSTLSQYIAVRLVTNTFMKKGERFEMDVIVPASGRVFFTLLGYADDR